jgi:hypothetical protein
MLGAIGVRIEIDHRGRFGIIDAIKWQQLNGGAVLGIHAEIRAVATERCAERKLLPG